MYRIWFVLAFSAILLVDVSFSQDNELVMVTDPFDHRDIDNIPRVKTQPDDKNEMTAKEIIFAVRNGVFEVFNIDGYSLPEVTYNFKKIDSECGPVDSSGYCPSDNRIYIARKHMDLAYSHYGGDAALAFIVAHEYAHALQGIAERIGMGRFLKSDEKTLKNRELQADCLAGVILHWIPNIYFDKYDVDEIRAAAYLLGDFSDWEKIYTGKKWKPGGHHGVPKERLAAVESGMQAGKREDALDICEELFYYFRRK